MPTDMVLVQKGLTVTRAGLLDQALRHIALEAKYRSELDANGWTPANGAELVSTFDLLKTQMAETADARAGSQMNRLNEQGAINEAKAYKRKLLHGFADLLADGRVLPPDYKLVYRSGSLGRSTPKILEYFVKIRDQVSKYDTDLTPYFGGTSALSLFDNALSQLEAAQGTQELNLKALPQETLKIYELKGRLLSLIEKMNRIGKIAFDGQAPVIAEFNKDLLLRARQKRRTTSAVEPLADSAMNEDKVSGEEDTG